jgi:hypothetical protein
MKPTNAWQLYMNILYVEFLQNQPRKMESKRRNFLMPLSKYGKGKAFPLQALTGPEGSRRLRLPDF